MPLHQGRGLAARPTVPGPRGVGAAGWLPSGPLPPPPPCGLVMVPVWPYWCLSLSLCVPLCCLYCSLLLTLTIS